MNKKKKNPFGGLIVLSLSLMVGGFPILILMHGLMMPESFAATLTLAGIITALCTVAVLASYPIIALGYNLIHPILNFIFLKKKEFQFSLGEYVLMRYETSFWAVVFWNNFWLTVKLLLLVPALGLIFLALSLTTLGVNYGLLIVGIIIVAVYLVRSIMYAKGEWERRNNRAIQTNYRVIHPINQWFFFYSKCTYDITPNDKIHEPKAGDDPQDVGIKMETGRFYEWWLSSCANGPYPKSDWRHWVFFWHEGQQSINIPTFIRTAENFFPSVKDGKRAFKVILEAIDLEDAHKSYMNAVQVAAGKLRTGAEDKPGVRFVHRSAEIVAKTFEAERTAHIFPKPRTVDINRVESEDINAIKGIATASDTPFRVMPEEGVATPTTPAQTAPTFNVMPADNDRDIPV